MKGAQGNVFSNPLADNLEIDVGRLVRDALVESVRRVKRARQWHRVKPLTRAFAEAFLIMKLKTVKSLDLSLIHI